MLGAIHGGGEVRQRGLLWGKEEEPSFDLLMARRQEEQARLMGSKTAAHIVCTLSAWPCMSPTSSFYGIISFRFLQLSPLDLASNFLPCPDNSVWFPVSLGDVVEGASDLESPECGLKAQLYHTRGLGSTAISGLQFPFFSNSLFRSHLHTEAFLDILTKIGPTASL